MIIVRRGAAPSTPWKNGGGVTHQIAVHPAGADLDGFDWRLSLAEVAADGPFSTFPGIDRTLTVIEGAGIGLDFGDGSVTLTPASAPLSFPGEAPVTGRLPDGPILDFNVMTRRGATAHRVTAAEVPGVSLPADATAVLCRSGRVTLDGAAMAPGDCALLQGGQAAPSLGGAGRIVIVSIDLMDAAPSSGEYPASTRHDPPA